LLRIILTVGLIGLGSAAARAERIREVVAYDDVRIDVIAEGTGPLVVLLPGRGRTSEDFDEVAAGLAQSGFACCGRNRAAPAAAPGRCTA
jgi:predicted dienelactone hydrolase